MAMTSISPKTPTNPHSILSAYGLQNSPQAVQTILSIPGFQGDSTAWLARLAEAYIRTSVMTCDTGTAAGKTRKHVEVNVTYIYRCTILPFGDVLGHSALTAYIAYLRGLPNPIPTNIGSVVDEIERSFRWNVPLHGRAVVDYWAG
jgi:hypothetical protein